MAGSMATIKLPLHSLPRAKRRALLYNNNSIRHKENQLLQDFFYHPYVFRVIGNSIMPLTF